VRVRVVMPGERLFDQREHQEPRRHARRYRKRGLAGPQGVGNQLTAAFKDGSRSQAVSGKSIAASFRRAINDEQRSPRPRDLEVPVQVLTERKRVNEN
jgi:hypothetical protein